MVEDTELLRRYAEEGTESAFAELVRRRIGLVYGVALRHTHHAQRAEEVAQQVFTDLARKAGALANRPALIGWLYRSARFAAAESVRAEHRRQVREQEAHVMQQIDRDASGPDWNALRPVLDDVLDGLNDIDRDAVLLRFFDEQPFGEIGRRLRLSENTARMRVERALGKMQMALARRGVTSTTGALALAIAGSASAATPAGLATSVTSLALGAAKVAGVAATAGVWTFMGTTKTQMGVATAIAALGLTSVAIQMHRTAELETELTLLRQESRNLAELRAEHQRLKATATEVQNYDADDAEFARLRVEVAALQRRPAPSASLPSGNVPWPNGHPVYEPGQVDAPPNPTLRAAPSYPFDMRRRGIGGEATISFIVDHEGVVQEAVVTSATPPEAGPAALQAVKQWRFEPARKNGQPANVRQQVPITFGIAPTRSTGGGWF